MSTKIFDVIVIGGGQAGLAVGYYLRRAELDFIILDNQQQSGGAWRHTWPSLRLFSPAWMSSLPGRLMPQSKEGKNPHRDEVLSYLADYEQHYKLPIYRPYDVQSVERDDQNDCLRVSDGRYTWLANAVVSATGTWNNYYIPDIQGRQDYLGEQRHSAHYQGPEAYKGKRVLVIGGGNSGAQIYAELVQFADASWVTREPPQFLPDDVDGRALFDRATARITGQYNSDSADEDNSDKHRLVDINVGNIVMVPAVKKARDKGLLTTLPMFSRLTQQGVVWSDGRKESIDAIIWCTGFEPELEHLAPLGVIEEDGSILNKQGQALKEPRLWLFGYGNWASPASATLIGAGRSARENVPVLLEFLSNNN
ncbi:ArsO family NAD(P)H-dependent flavin-containing monooxygenase [Psychrobacter jeotgali]|uniref:ArsO family NAD(P)H-dependent flavin-containing monooxygenase n=1 Tax=Psychrobacter jeotgali TaxID=179010 RepID=UPI00191A20F6|nr:ArsO family NAD(P)H-dependent flavin-containing monooxygenase [Psychrobacter jeotgali]